MYFIENLKWYRGKARVLVHVFFWLIVVCYEGYQTTFLIKDWSSNKLLLLLFTLREVLTFALVFYFLSYFVFPKFLLRARWLLLILSFVGCYIFVSASTYYTMYYIKSLENVTGDLNQLTLFFGQYSFFASLIQPSFIYTILLSYSNLIYVFLAKTLKDYFFASVKKLTLENENIRLEKNNIQFELDFLRAQINPHFFFNTFNNIYSMIESTDRKAASLLMRLSDLMRYSLYESSAEVVSLEREISFIEDYINLEKVRHKEGVSIEMHKQGSTKDLYIPPMILITFIENAIKHGLNQSIGNSWIKIDIQILDQLLLFRVDNSKLPEKEETNREKGIGIINVQRRLDLLYPSGHRLNIEDKGDRYCVQLEIQLDGKV